MGWSCARSAGQKMQAWCEACQRQTGSSNTFEVKGTKYFWQTSNREHHDGAITGSVFKMLPNERALVSGSFRIEPNGHVTKAPSFLKNL